MTDAKPATWATVCRQIVDLMTAAGCAPSEMQEQIMSAALAAIWTELPVDEPARAYQQARLRGEAPEWVPATVRVLEPVRSEIPFHRVVLQPGDVAVECNRYGAVSARTADGKSLGLTPREFTVLTWRRA